MQIFILKYFKNYWHLKFYTIYYLITRLSNFMQEFFVKYAHKYEQKSIKICKNVLKYAKKLFSIKCRYFTRNNLLLLILRVLISLIQQFFTLHSNRVKCKMCLCRKILWKYFYISLGVVRSLPWGPRGLAVRRLLQMQEVVGSNRTESKICF